MATVPVARLHRARRLHGRTHIAAPGRTPECRLKHDLRHYFASLLITSGADVKVVQKRLRHASAMTTLNTYGHMWPDVDESARVAIAGVLAARAKAKESEVLSTN